MSDPATKARTGRRLHLYGALLECGADGQLPDPGTPAAIWHRIDMLRGSGGSTEEIRLLEGLSVEVHALRQSLDRSARDEHGDPMPRVRIAALTREWLAFAPLSA